MTEENNKIDVINTPEPTPAANKVGLGAKLKQSLKKFSPTLKRILPYILVGVICFVLGIGADRVFTRHRFTRAYKGRPAIERNLPNKGDNSFNQRGNGGGNRFFQGRR